MTAEKQKRESVIADQHCRIVIIGANFAGLTAAMRLPRSCRTSVIDSRPYFEFLPNIHELLSGIKSAESLRIDRKRLIERAGHRFIQDTVSSIDPVKKRVYTSKSKKLPYDICLVATGGINNTLGISGAAKYGMPFKTAEHCRDIGQRLKDLNRNNRRVTIVIVGGGLEGIEALGEILRRYRGNPKLEVHIVEKNKRLLSGEPAAIDRDIKNICNAYNVHFHTTTKINRVAKNKVWLSSGKKLHSDATIWTGGAAPSPLLHRSGLTEHPGKWAPVKATLQSNFFESIFIAGDAADFPGLRIKQAYHAMDMGELVTQNIKLLLADKNLKAFRPSSKSRIISKTIQHTINCSST